MTLASLDNERLGDSPGEFSVRHAVFCERACPCTLAVLGQPLAQCAKLRAGSGEVTPETLPGADADSSGILVIWRRTPQLARLLSHGKMEDFTIYPETLFSNCTRGEERLVSGSDLDDHRIVEVHEYG